MPQAMAALLQISSAYPGLTVRIRSCSRKAACTHNPVRQAVVLISGQTLLPGKRWIEECRRPGLMLEEVGHMMHKNSSHTASEIL